jgi:hypothetical protein
MTDPAAPHGTTSTLPPPSANGSAPPPAAPQPPGRGRLQTRIGPARITQLRQIIRHALGKEPHGWA